MATVKKSFLSGLFGEGIYRDIIAYAKPIITVGTCILAILFLLSFFLHWVFISKLLSFFTGTSILFIVYIAAIIVVLDREVEVYEPERDPWSEPEKTPMTTAYKHTIIRGVVLILLGILAIYFTNRYRKQYAFDCSTILVDRNAGIYHLKRVRECEVAARTSNLVEMKGYEIKGLGYTICDWCKEYVEEEEEVLSERYNP